MYPISEDIMRRIILACCLILQACLGWRSPCLRTRSESSRMSMSFDVPLIPAIVLSSAAVFAVFNIENKVDLTDEGRWKARKARRDAKIASGQTPPRKKEGSDPFAYKLFADDDDDDLSVFPRKTGGGCG